MIKLYTDNEGDFYILNDDWSGIRISDGYWDNYGSRIPLKEITRITIDNKIGHFFEPHMKIISKHKDYYDYFQGIYGVDKMKILDRR